MDSLAKRARPVLKVLGVFLIIIGFLGMALISFQLVKNVYDLIFVKGAKSAVGVIQPFAQDVPGTIFVPFIYFMISIFVIAVLHEFSHGVMARAHGCKVRSSGFAFLGVLLPIIPAAFVEPDEKEMSKRSISAQLSILSAGAVVNVLFAGLVLLLILFAIEPYTATLLDSKGVEVIKVESNSPALDSGLASGDLITKLDGITVASSKNLLEILSKKSPGDTLSIETSVDSHAVLLSSSPSSPSKAYLGVQVMNKLVPKPSAVEQFGSLYISGVQWAAHLLFWIFNLSLGIGLFNLVPLGPIDGGKMLRLALGSWFKEGTAHCLWVVVSIAFLSLIVFNVGAAFFL